MTSTNERDTASERDVLHATLRFNALVFGVILGTFAGAVLLVLGMIAAESESRAGLAVVLLSVFLPGYASGLPGALFGFLWGFVFAALVGTVIYRIHGRHVLEQVDRLVIPEGATTGFPAAVLRLDGPSLGLAIGFAGALGLIVTTNILVLRGTAAESVRARLLGEVLPGYAVSVAGSIIGAIELFVVLYLFCRAFAFIYNLFATRRPRR
jgi:hypothetical protein